jgi:hypothetical protein
VFFFSGDFWVSGSF